MNLGELRASLREEVLDDAVEPPLWPDEVLNRYLNNAVREACIRARLLKVDASTDPELCRIEVEAQQAIVSFDPCIIAVRSAIIEGGTHKLYAVTAESLDVLEPGWDNGAQDPSTPCYMVMDLQQKALQLYPAPAQALVLRLRVWRVPSELELMEDDDEQPAIHLPDAEELRHWAAHEAYLHAEAERYDAAKSAAHLQLFESRFGTRPTLHDMARWADSPPRVRRVQTF